MPKFLRNREDGYVFAYNEHAAGRKEFEVIEADEPPHPDSFLSPAEQQPAEPAAKAPKAKK